ncbi:alpha/beta fold hydrolase [Variovorax sp. GB1P17]|uniref:alpha/beta fold hydrolase n=1 Tax=Variovorax sp. GB1P17 TaxID=3443740 RepID=UPI003F478025
MNPGDAAPHVASSHFVQLGELRFHYVAWGPQGAPVVLCLHGLRSYARTFAPLASVLADEFRVVALDQRGRGRTDWDPARNYHAARYAGDIAEFIDALGLDTVHLLGHSMGGINSLVYALTHGQRLRSLVLEDSGPGASRCSDGAHRINTELARTPASFPDWETARRFWRSIRPTITEAAIDSRVANSMREADGVVTWAHDQAGITHCRMHPTQPDPDLWPCVAAIACPTLLLRGAESDYLSRDTFAQMLAANDLITGLEVAGAGHYVHDDQPAAFAKAVHAFLSSQRS